MTPDPSARTDDRLDEMPMLPVACRSCGARVLVRKSSWNQTSVQWDADSTTKCVERIQAQRVSLHERDVFLACSALSASIVDAVRHGELPVVDEIVDEMATGASPRTR